MVDIVVEEEVMGETGQESKGVVIEEEDAVGHGEERGSK